MLNECAFQDKEEEDLYMVPAMDEEGLYSQLDIIRAESTFSRSSIE